VRRLVADCVNFTCCRTVFSFLIVFGLIIDRVAVATATVSVAIKTPVSGATVTGTVTIATAETSNVSWINVFVDNVWVASNSPTALPPYSVTWNSATVANGKHSLSVAAYNSSNEVIASTLSPVTVLNQYMASRRTASPTPTRTPRPTATRTPAPTRTSTPAPIATSAPSPTASATCCPLSDSAAASMVILNPDFEPRPDNYPANDTVPTTADLAQIGKLSFLDSHGNDLLAKVTGNFTGTTDEILQWASYKWGFDADITRAIAVTESHWHQDDIGDVGYGVSLGILQIKSADYVGTCSPVALNGGDIGHVDDPLCLSHLMTAFAADYKLAYQRACMDGSIGYLNQDTPTGGHATYAAATGDERMWGCVGDWFSGNWYDSGALDYIQQVQAYLSAKPWLEPGF
jgi:hypothetical protein